MGVMNPAINIKIVPIEKRQNTKLPGPLHVLGRMLLHDDLREMGLTRRDRMKKGRILLLWTIEHGREYRKQEETLDESVTERSVTVEGNQYDDVVNNSAASIGMDMDSLQDSTEEIGAKNMEKDWATPLSPLPLTDRDDNKVEKKRDKTTNAVGERTRQESGEHATEEGTRQVAQSLSHKRNKKIKVEKESEVQRERKRSKSRLKTTQHH
jgi:hypothetical protein